MWETKGFNKVKVQFEMLLSLDPIYIKQTTAKCVDNNRAKARRNTEIPMNISPITNKESG